MLFKKKTYDETLVETLNLSEHADTMHGAPINTYFRNLAPDIALCMNYCWRVHYDYSRDFWHGTEGNYAQVRVKEISFRAKNHASTKTTPLTAENTLVLVHPFFLHLSNWDYMHPFIAPHATNYILALTTVFNHRAKNNALDIVVFDTAHHYTSISSIFVERGAINKVMFTHANAGSLIDYDALKMLDAKNIFVAGMYNSTETMYGNDNGCLSGALSAIVRDVKDRKNLYVIRDLCLDSPQGINRLKPLVHSLQPQDIYYWENDSRTVWPQEQTINLKQFIELTTNRS